MKKTTVLFDLDGTLLPMDQDKFIKGYFGGLCSVVAPHGYSAETLVKAIWAGTEAMVKNDGSKTNENRFWETFNSIVKDCDPSLFDNYYKTEFDKVSSSCGYNPAACDVVECVRKHGLTPVLATNPIFPSVATHARIRWAGLDPSDFAYISTYENSTYCKPNPDYYRQILERLNLVADECVMVGNDTVEDMAAEKLGMPVFILTDCIINKNNLDLSNRPHGDFNDLIRFIENI